jgi:hypothetical protein
VRTNLVELVQPPLALLVVDPVADARTFSSFAGQTS